MTNSSRNVLISIIVILLALNFRDSIKSLINKAAPTQTPIVEKITEKEDLPSNQFPFSTLEYDINLGSTQIPDSVVEDKTSLFKIKCKITKDLDKFNVNYQIQYFGKPTCGLCLMPITTQNQSSNSYDFVQFEHMKTLEFNNQINTVDQLKNTKPFIFFLEENDKVKTFNFMSLDDVSVPF